ncbi:MAG: acyl-CoA dehydrogenase [Rickettsiales bacterium]|nr:acyl-CoA dehydrogenase [Rickettsiales bacterium]|tara:strand:+ start:2629 stop:4476 length:1848 start_codon:yes stop_codon:yes gene_type:complete
MNTQNKIQVSEEESRALAEASRETEWKNPSFMKELFLGNFRFDLIHPYPERTEWRPEFTEFFDKLTSFLRDTWDPVEVDASGEYNMEHVAQLAEMGAFGMKIPTEYGGLGFDQLEYAQVMELLGCHDGNLTALLSAHQSIGVPQPLKLFGSDALKQQYLPRCASGEISAFALTEPEVGSDPARLTTSVRLSEDGEHFLLNGTKLWCTNGTLAKLLVVMAKHQETGKISAFVVETDWAGVSIDHRCHFMGLKALANAVITFADVKIPVGNLIGKEGRGLKIALTTLNDGRLSIPNTCVGIGKGCLTVVREWASTRTQWGVPVGKHESLAHKISDMASVTFAMESIVKLTSYLSNNKKLDLRLESAACKEWNTWQAWEIVDDAMQIRGGRGYETEVSLKARGEEPWPCERIMRDSRINKIFEGSSEIMHLLMAREAVDKHLSVAGAMVDPKSTVADKLKALPSIALFYAWWYPTRWLNSLTAFYFGYGRWGKHLRFIHRSAAKLARESFHGMLLFREKLERRQVFLFRLVDVVNELFAMTASIARAIALEKRGASEAAQAADLADAFCLKSRRVVKQRFAELWSNDDLAKVALSSQVLKGDHVWMEAMPERLNTFRK